MKHDFKWNPTEKAMICQRCHARESDKEECPGWCQCC